MQDKYSVGVDLGNSPEDNYGKDDDLDDDEDVPNYLKGEQSESGEVVDYYRKFYFIDFRKNQDRNN